MKKISKHYRLHPLVVELLEEVKTKLKINETQLIEMALVEKYHNMGFREQFNNDRINYINYQIKSLEKARNEEK